MHFLIFTGGDLQPGPAVDKVLSKYDRIIAVDSGASHCSGLNITPDFVVGDFDSIDKKLLIKLKKGKTKIITFRKKKNETDTELAIETAIQNGATKVTILGALNGERADHSLGNILLLLKKKFAKLNLKIIDGNQEIYLAKKGAPISGKKGDTISVIPMSGSVLKVSSTGLRYNLSKYHLSIQGNRGISNIMTQPIAKINWKIGTLLLIHTIS